ncbi:MAG: transglycosylase domain-containing protein [Candidatus Saccharimonadales bacterium]
MSNTPSRSRRKAKNTYTTKSGKTIKLNRSLSDRIKASRDAKARRKAAALSTLPKEPWKRWLYRFSPKRLYKYWFSREGGIMALKVAGISFVVVFLLLVGLFAYFRKDLPKIKNLNGASLGGSITYYDRTGQTVLWQDYDAVKRIPVDGNKMSKYMRQATVAIEDKDFYKHGAFDVRGIARAGIHDAFGSSGGTQGGSTITQQLVKLNEGWGNDRTISRKVKELILAVELEREYTKEDVLTGYLNIAPYGNVDYGVETASRDYFGIGADQLTLAQAAMLSAIPKAPTAYSPYSSPVYNPAATANMFDANGLLSRQRYILDQMAKQGYIKQSEADAAKKVDVLAQVQPLKSHYQGIKAPYFALAAKEQLQKEFPADIVKRGGWKVITTLDMNLQTLAESQLQKGLAQIHRQNADNAAFVAEDNQTGQVVALIGGVDFNNQTYGQINYASDVNISPGSSVKPYDYSTFIENNNNVGAGSVLYDQVGPLPGYPCSVKGGQQSGGNCLNDYDHKSPGPITLRYALGGSRNIPAVKAMLSAVPNDTSSGRTTSISKVISTASALMNNPNGYRCFKPGTDVTTATSADETQCYGSAGIGDGAYLHLTDHVNGIASIARLGKAIPQTFILKVTDAANKNILVFNQPAGKQVIRPDSAYIVTDMASDPKASYLGGSCSDTNCSSYKFHRYKGWHNAIKTGTTNDLYDGLMVSWNTKYTAGIWVGNHTRTVSYSGQPEYMTDPIVKGWMQGAIDQLGNVPAVNWVKPSGVKTLPAFINRTSVGFGQTVPGPSTDLFPSWYVGKTATNSSQVTDKVSNKVATSCTPELAKQSNANSNVSVWNVDLFVGGSPSGGGPASSQANAPTDDIHNCGDSPPAINVTNVTCADVKKTCDFRVVVGQGTFALAGGTYTTAPAGTLTLLVNGQTVQTQAIDPSNITYDFKDVPTNLTDVVTVQVVDSVLYSATSAAATIPPSYNPTN